MFLVKKLFNRRNNTVSHDTNKLERIVEYYANGEMSKEEFEEVKDELTLKNYKELLDKYYSVALSENTKKAQSAMRASGRTTGYAPLGYKNIVNSNGKHDVVLDKETALKVEYLFTQYTREECTLKHLAKLARWIGLKGKISKQPLSKVAVKNILSNPFYCGYARHQGTLFKHKYKPLISEDLFMKCQDKLF